MISLDILIEIELWVSLTRGLSMHLIWHLLLLLLLLVLLGGSCCSLLIKILLLRLRRDLSTSRHLLHLLLRRNLSLRVALGWRSIVLSWVDSILLRLHVLGRHLLGAWPSWHIIHQASRSTHNRLLWELLRRAIHILLRSSLLQVSSNLKMIANHMRRRLSWRLRNLLLTRSTHLILLVLRLMHLLASVSSSSSSRSRLLRWPSKTMKRMFMWLDLVKLTFSSFRRLQLRSSQSTAIFPLIIMANFAEVPIPRSTHLLVSKQQ